jgi:thiol-disulfide isomerase/thioredoxin
MRSLICGIILLSLVVGCTKTAEYDVVKIPKADSDESSDAAAAQDGQETDAKLTPAVFNVGDPAPAFSDLIGVDDKKHSLDEFKDAKAIAVVFTCNKCPVAVMYEDRLNQYQKDYADKGVQVVAINVNNAEADRLPAMKLRAEEKGFAFPYLYDETQKSAREYNAEVTPHIFLLDSERKLVFKGPIDDSPEDETKVTKTFLRDATDAVLSGKPVETTDVKAAGCGIQYE